MLEYTSRASAWKSSSAYYHNSPSQDGNKRLQEAAIATPLLWVAGERPVASEVKCVLKYALHTNSEARSDHSALS